MLKTSINHSRQKCAMSEGTCLGNRKITICEVVKVLGISFGSVQSILKDNLNTQQTATKYVPCLLNRKLEI
jgi:hypothetical protein